MATNIQIVSIEDGLENGLGCGWKLFNTYINFGSKVQLVGDDLLSQIQNCLQKELKKESCKFNFIS